MAFLLQDTVIGLAYRNNRGQDSLKDEGVEQQTQIWWVCTLGHPASSRQPVGAAHEPHFKPFFAVAFTFSRMLTQIDWLIYWLIDVYFRFFDVTPQCIENTLLYNHVQGGGPK